MNAMATTSPATKPPPGSLCPRRNRYTATTHGDRQQQAHEHRRHHHVAERRVGGRARIDEVGRDIGQQQALLPRRLDALARRPEAPQQRVHGERRRRASTVISPIVSKPRKSTSMTLTTLLPPPSGSARSRKNGEMLCGAGRVSIAYDERREAAAGDDREHQVAPAPNPRARGDARVVGLDALRQPAQAEQEQHGGDDLDDELRQREVGRREPHEREADDEPDALPAS